MDSLTIEKAGHRDIESIKKLEADSGLSPWTKDDYLQEINANNEFFLVVKKNQKLIGFLLARLIMNDSSSFIISEIEIYNIAVNKNYRREKIASRLIENLIEKAGIYNVNKVYLEVRESNLNAQELYLNRLFKITGKRKNFYTNPCENAILMCRELS